MRYKNCGKCTIGSGGHFAKETYQTKAIVSALTHCNMGTLLPKP